MIFNPEFRRNISLQFTWSRLIVAPLVALILVYAFTAAIDTHFELIENVAELFGGVLIIGLWGTRRVADSLAEEVSGGTWESQRMSGLGAWQMTWGKLVGSNGFVWYCATIAMLIVFWAGKRLSEDESPTRTAMQVLFEFAVGGLLAHATAFAVGLILMRKAAQHRRLTITLAQTCGLMVFWFVVRDSLSHGPLSRGEVLGEPRYFLQSGHAVAWYGWLFEVDAFHVVMVSCYCLWALVAAYRLMRNELQYRSLPWVWTAFLIFVGIGAGGFSNWPQFGPAARLVSPFLGFVLLTYLSFFADHRDPVRYRWALIAVRSGSWTEALASLPWWVISYVFAAAAALVIGWSFPETVELTLGRGSEALHVVVDAASRHISASLALLMLFMLRDLLVLLWLSCGPWRSRADVAGLIYLAVIYWPLAAIFWVTGGQYLLPVVVPIATGNIAVDYLPIAIELVFAAFLFYARWREITRLKPR
ncbi:MAG TPA: hypothetical protein VGM59_04225 [Dongiaceae bacterium]